MLGCGGLRWSIVELNGFLENMAGLLEMRVADAAKKGWLKSFANVDQRTLHPPLTLLVRRRGQEVFTPAPLDHRPKHLDWIHYARGRRKEQGFGALAEQKVLDFFHLVGPVVVQHNH